MSTDEYYLKDSDPRWKNDPPDKVVDDVGVLDYVEPGNRKCSKLVCSKAVRVALLELWLAKEFVISENLTTLLPWRTFADKTE